MRLSKPTFKPRGEHLQGEAYWQGVPAGECRFGAVLRGQAGGVLLTRSVDVSGLGGALSRALVTWRRPFAVHDPGKIITDLAVSLALGGDCLADVGLIRSEPGVYGRVASDPTISTRLISLLAKDAPAALKVINFARAEARTRAWGLAGERAPDHDISPASPLIIDVDATLVTAHSDKENARPTFKRGYGFHPLCAFVDHGAEGTGKLLAIQLRAGNAGSNTATDHIQVIREGFRQLPGHQPGVRHGPARVSWSGLTGLVAPISWSSGWSHKECSTRSAIPCPPTPRRSSNRSRTSAGPPPGTPKASPAKARGWPS